MCNYFNLQGVIYVKDAKEQLKNRVAVSKGTSNDFSIERRSLNFEKNKI